MYVRGVSAGRSERGGGRDEGVSVKGKGTCFLGTSYWGMSDGLSISLYIILKAYGVGGRNKAFGLPSA